MVAGSTAHPDREQLRAFGAGRLAPEEAAALEQHLSGCDLCCRALEDEPADAFVDQLRKAYLPPVEHTEGYVFDPAAPPAAADDVPPDLARHPRYRVLRLLGKGGMGAVYLAEHRRMGRPVALKVIDPRLLRHPGALPRFQHEVRAAAQLDHANIVAAYDADQAGDLHFLVMEYVEGQNLADHLAAGGPLPVARACDYVRQAALGLQHAHERGMVHRDIKPHNLMRDPGGRVKVLDFGLARFAAEPAGEAATDATATVPHLTGLGAVMGTADYIAPEQARDAHGADARADVYSLGCTLYHLLAGRPPFPGGTAAEKLRRHASQDPPPLAALRPEVPEGLTVVVGRMMAKEPEGRYPTAAAAAAALAPYAQAARGGRGRRGWLAAVTLVALAAVPLAVTVRLGAVKDQQDASARNAPRPDPAPVGGGDTGPGAEAKTHSAPAVNRAVRVRFEAEDLQFWATRCWAWREDMKPWGESRWSQGRQLVCASDLGGELLVHFPVRQAGNYHIELVATRSPNYCKVQVWLNGKRLGPVIDGRGERIEPTGPVRLGTCCLEAGTQDVCFQVVAKNPHSSGQHFGIDYIDLIPANP
jgi:tRNA A-37 threonylcarbamoyl transferase component Bud32